MLLGGTFFVFFVAGLWIFRRRAELAPFMVYFAVMFFVMGAIFTFHAPKGAFYHSAPAWLPWAFGIAAAALAPAASAAGRFWPFLRRPATHRFLAVAGVAGAVVLSVIGSAILFQQWDRSRVRDEQVAAFLRANAEPDDVFMASDPASIYPLTGNPGVAAPFDPFRVIEQVVDAYDVRWVVVLSPGDGEPDPLNMWDGAAGHGLGGRRTHRSCPMSRHSRATTCGSTVSSTERLALGGDPGARPARSAACHCWGLRRRSVTAGCSTP